MTVQSTGSEGSTKIFSFEYSPLLLYGETGGARTSLQRAVQFLRWRHPDSSFLDAWPASEKGLELQQTIRAAPLLSASSPDPLHRTLVVDERLHPSKLRPTARLVTTTPQRLPQLLPVMAGRGPICLRSL